MSWNAAFDSSGRRFDIPGVTPSIRAVRAFGPFLATIAFCSAVGLPAQEFTRLAPFLVSVPGQADVAVEAGAEAARSCVERGELRKAAWTCQIELAMKHSANGIASRRRKWFEANSFAGRNSFESEP